jgi:hypothetical protein
LELSRQIPEKPQDGVLNADVTLCVESPLWSPAPAAFLLPKLQGHDLASEILKGEPLRLRAIALVCFRPGMHHWHLRPSRCGTRVAAAIEAIWRLDPAKSD